MSNEAFKIEQQEAVRILLHGVTEHGGTVTRAALESLIETVFEAGYLAGMAATETPTQIATELGASMHRERYSL